MDDKGGPADEILTVRAWSRLRTSLSAQRHQAEGTSTRSNLLDEQRFWHELRKWAMFATLVEGAIQISTVPGGNPEVPCSS